MLLTPSPWALVAAFAFDRYVGELPTKLHPVVWMGTAGRWLGDRALAAPALGALLSGFVITLGISVLAGALGLWVRWVGVASALGVALEALVLTSTFAVRALTAAVEDVRAPLCAGDLETARVQLRSLCSRDPLALGAPEVSAAAIESSAENTCDSIVAPLFYYALCGLAGALAYRAVNTLDATLGYRGRFEHVGKASARLDDLLNLVPARLTAACLWLAATAGWTSRRRGLSIWWRDARETESPNAGHPMAMMAGLLGRQLGKAGSYTLGRGLPAPGETDIACASRIVKRASWLALLLALLAIGFRP